MKSTVLLAVAALLVVGLVFLVPIPTAEAAPIYFEDDFRGCADGTSPPPGWTRSGSTSALIDECSDLESFPNPDNGTLPGYGTFLDGFNSFRIRRADATCCPLGSHTASFSLGGDLVFSAGFAFRYVDLGFQPIFLSDLCENPGAFQFFVSSGGTGGPGICVDGDDPPDQDDDSLFAREAASLGWVDTGIDLVNNTWYRFRFDVDLSVNSYDLYMNETLISSGRNAGTSDDVDTVLIQTRGHSTFFTEVFVDWIFVGHQTIDPIPDTTVALCFPETAAEATILNLGVDSDPFHDVFWGFEGTPPIWITIGPSNGKVVLFLMPPRGPPALGTFPLEIKTNVSSGRDVDDFNLTITSCDPLTWVRAFGPAWLVFLVFVVTISFLVLMLWRGAHQNRRGRR